MTRDEREPRKRFRDHGSPTSRWVLIPHREPNALLRLVNNVSFWLRHAAGTFRAKVLYAVLPPPWIRNIGDQAQVVAILAWLRRVLPDHDVLPMNQSESVYYLPALRLLLRRNDLVFLHSGGNLGDRYMGSERARRSVIQAFPRNTILSLPQTICFSDTALGSREKQLTARIYDAHPRLSILCRDRVSARIAVSMFDRLPLFCVPDFVLSLPPQPDRPPDGGILICRRQDAETLYDEAAWVALSARLARPCTFFDTRFEDPIQPEEREARLAETLELFQKHELVITDRFHAIIFAILCRRPSVALPTIDHKISSSRLWFRGVSYASGMDEVPELAARAIERGFVEEEAWNTRYFDDLLARVGIQPRAAPVPAHGGTDVPLAGRWRPVPPFQKPDEFVEDGDVVTFRGGGRSTDEWCMLAVEDGARSWRDVSWTLDARRGGGFREFAFNFRYVDFDNRYRFRFEGRRVYFDKRIGGRWSNHIASVPFVMEPGVWYRLRIEAIGTMLSLFIDDRLTLRIPDPDLSSGGVAVVLWETDGRTPLAAEIRAARVRLLESAT